MEFRIEKDSIGEVSVPADKFWGAQTQRSLENFPIGEEKMPSDIILTFAKVKMAAAFANLELGVLSQEKTAAIVSACEDILSGKLGDNFPLSVWQTGSGTQSNMNVNEVIANYANEKAGYKLLHPNDDVNKSQSSNDTFPTAMSVASYVVVVERLLPALDSFMDTLRKKEAEFEGIIKVGRTHLQDAVPLKLSQEISGWRVSLENGYRRLESAVDDLRYIALGATAVGTGLNAPEGYDELVAEKLGEITGLDIRTARNKFTALSFRSEFANAHGAITSIACDMLKIANDIRWLACGPRAGFAEFIIPSNEPGSSIMPGKVNPTQAEALSMVVARVMGNDTTVKFATSQGNFQLNVYLPVIAYSFLQSAVNLADAIESFRARCLEGMRANVAVIEKNLNNSLMLVTALNTHIGYDNAAAIAKTAYAEDISLREATVRLGFMKAEEFDEVVDPQKLTGK